jgi:hypothetical protein
LTTIVSASGQRSTVETFTLSTAKGSVTIQLTKLVAIPGTPATAHSSFSIVKSRGHSRAPSTAAQPTSRRSPRRSPPSPLPWPEAFSH